jgi:hypothetical protein
MFAPEFPGNLKTQAGTSRLLTYFRMYTQWDYNKLLFNSVPLADCICVTLLRTFRHVFAHSLRSGDDATCSKIKKAPTTNGVYLPYFCQKRHYWRTLLNANKRTATRCWLLQLLKELGENCWWLLQRHPEIPNFG